MYKKLLLKYHDNAKYHLNPVFPSLCMGHWNTRNGGRKNKKKPKKTVGNPLRGSRQRTGGPNNSALKATLNTNREHLVLQICDMNSWFHLEAKLSLVIMATIYPISFCYIKLKVPWFLCLFASLGYLWNIFPGGGLKCSVFILPVLYTSIKYGTFWTWYFWCWLTSFAVIHSNSKFTFVSISRSDGLKI